jgi:hypothetical protein
VWALGVAGSWVCAGVEVGGVRRARPAGVAAGVTAGEQPGGAGLVGHAVAQPLRALADEGGEGLVDGDRVAGEVDDDGAFGAAMEVAGREVPTIPLVGASSVAHLNESLAAVDLELTADQRTRLDAAR